VRAFVEESVEGNGYAGAFADAVGNVRRYFRNDGTRWLLSEPTLEETGLSSTGRSAMLMSRIAG
jgi:hypothetical protein